MTITRGDHVAGNIDHEKLWLAIGLLACVAGLAVYAGPGFPPLVCPLKLATGLPCLSCGTTRAVLALAGGSVLAALRLNPLIVVTAAAWSIWALHAAATLAFGWPRLRVAWTPADLRVGRQVLGAIVAAVWVFLIVDGR